MTADQPENPRQRRQRYPGKYPKRFDQRYKELAPDRHPDIHEHVRDQGRTPAATHVPVLVAEVMAALPPGPGDTVVDCTVGYGGHALEFLRRIGPAGTLLGFDLDAAELERTRVRLMATAGPHADTGEGGGQSCPPRTGQDCPPREESAAAAGPHVIFRRGNFAGIDRALAEEGLGAADIIFADLGVSSMQVDDPSRGFSYKFDGPLDMRMDARIPRTAADLLRILPEAKIAATLSDFADEPDAESIARRIVEERERRPIARTLELVDLVFAVKGLSRRKWREQLSTAGDDLHPAARTFQALRILVNDELAALRQLLRVAPACLTTGGRIGIVSFHSGEDRLVKHAFREGLDVGAYSAIAEDVIRPGPEERRVNPRSASAKFRWAVKAWGGGPDGQAKLKFPAASDQSAVQPTR
jgi:16S rRNA (cytosine1402-N4)-methyltransferase